MRIYAVGRYAALMIITPLLMKIVLNDTINMKISRRKSNQENPNKLDKGIIDSWLNEHGDPAIDRLVKKNLAIAKKIQEVLKK